MHHANIIISKEDCRDLVFDILAKNLGFKTKANPDFLLIENDFFGINDVRDFEKWIINKPFFGEVKVSLIIVKSITREAQNALLKILEEPPLGTYIFINLENLGGVLLTLLSRVRILNLSAGNNNLENKGSDFLHSKIKERLSMVRALAKKDDKNDMKELIKNLEEVAYKEKMSANQIKNVLTAKIFVTTRGSSPKMLLEWLACVV